MKYRVSFPKVHCISATKWEWFTDEIYFVVFAGLTTENSAELEAGKIGAGKIAYLPGHITTVQKDVDDGSVYVPVFNRGAAGPGPARFEFDSGHATALLLFIALYEEDDGTNHDALVNYLKLGDGNGGIDWAKYVEQALGAAISASGAGLVLKFIYTKLAAALVGLFKDDLLGEHVIEIPFEPESKLGPREYVFEKGGGKYLVALNVEAVG